jgi:outer membrane protein assembly factor BamA
MLCTIVAQFSAQKSKVHYVLPESVALPRYFQKNRVLSSKDFWTLEREKALLLLSELGYFTAQLKELPSKEGFLVEVLLGEKFEGITVRFEASLIPLLPSLKTDQEGTITFKNPKAYASALQGMMAEFHNNGYPFAAFRFNNFQAQEGHLSLDVRMEKGPFMVWHEVQLKGDSTLSSKTVLRMLDVPLGSPFSLQKLEEIDLKLKQQSFIEVIKPSEISFEKEGVVLYVYLKSNKSSSFNGALGLQPDPVSQRIGLTGDLQLRLLNSLHRAEQFDLNWRSIRPATQWLNARFMYPYLFNTLLGVDLRFQLYKRDSTFLELKSQLGIQYSFASHWLVKTMYNFSSSNRLFAASSNAQFPNVASLRNSMYGLGINYRKLDYLPNPRKGFILNLEGFVGQRKAVSDSNAVSTTAKVAFFLEQFVPLHRRWVFRYQLTFDTYFAPTIYSNECYRFGGLTTQRGFNEENFLSTTKSTNQVEIRYLLDRNSAVFVFIDQTFYENTSGLNYKNDRPFGFGVGANIGSKAGIFSLVYGLGTEQKNPLDFRSGKIHFGYIAYF